jgi:hypothetical protein
MTLARIAKQLQGEAAKGGSVRISGDLFASDDGSDPQASAQAFQKLVTDSLLRASGYIQLNVPNGVPGPSGDTLTFGGALPTSVADSFLNLTGNQVQATFTQNGATLQFDLLIQLTQGSSSSPLKWVFSRSFPDLFGWPFDAMPFSGPQFNFIFSTSPATPSQPQGLQFSSALTFSTNSQSSGFLAPVASWLTATGPSGTAPSAQAMSGFIRNTPFGAEFLLRATLNTAIVQMTALEIKNPFLGMSMYYEAPLEKGGEAIPHGSIFVGASTALKGGAKDRSNGSDVELQAFIAVPYIGSGSAMTMSIAPAPGREVTTSVADIGQWMGSAVLNQIFPQSQAPDPDGNPDEVPFLHSFGLNSYKLTFTTQNFSIISSALALGMVQPQYFPISGNKNVALTSLDAIWLVIDPFGSFVNTLSLKGTLLLKEPGGSGEVTFMGAISVPGLRFGLTMVSSEQTVVGLLQTVVGAFVPSGLPLPDGLAQALEPFELASASLMVNLPAKTGSCTVTGAFLLGDHRVGFTVLLSLIFGSKPGLSVGIGFDFGGFILGGEIEYYNDQPELICYWQSEGERVGLNYLAGHMGYQDLGIPAELDLDLAWISAAYAESVFLLGAASINYGAADLIVFQPEQSSSYALFAGLNVDKTIDLTKLPLIGKALSLLERVEIRGLQVLIASSPVTGAMIQQINKLVTKVNARASAEAKVDDPNAKDVRCPLVPAQGMNSTVDVSMVLNIAGYLIPIGSSVAMPPPNVSSVTPPDRDVAQGVTQGKASGEPAAVVPTTPSSQSDGTLWVNLQKAVGPVMFRRIGVRYRESVLWFVLDAKFAAGGLTIDLIGMAIGSPLADFDPDFTLAGLGIDYHEPGLEIGGALFKSQPPLQTGVDWEYAGGAIIRVGTISLTALGSYASMSGSPSLFVFAQISAPLGGLPSFFITGLAGGLGYNSSLRIPSMDDIYKFPLVACAQKPAPGGKPPTPAQMLTDLMAPSSGKPWLTVQPGQYWIAAGLTFSSYQIVATTAMVIAEFGKRLQFALIGLSKARFPMAPCPVTYAFVELQLSTVIDPDEGAFAVSAVLSPNSFLLDPACKLTGGFAFYTWFPPSDHSGDFVIAIGGYHPGFEPAPWYPRVPAVGFSWALDSTVSITGKAYFAMTPSGIMAGGQLRVTYQSGSVRAWFTAMADLILHWSPFHFDTAIGITAGVSYCMNMGFTTTTLEAEVGATLKLWGPATGGTVTISWSVITITVSFGAAATKDPGPLSWSEFAQMLPNEVVQIIPGEGLAPNGAADLNAGGVPWSVRPSSFSFRTASAIPCSQLFAGSSSAALATKNAINIRPMQKTGLVSTHQLTISCKGNAVAFGSGAGHSGSRQWLARQSVQSVPKALWGAGKQVQLPPGDEQSLDDQLVGLMVSSPPATSLGSLGAITVATAMKAAPTAGLLPVQPGAQAQGPAAAVSADAIQTITNTIATSASNTARTELFDSLVKLGVDPLTNQSMGAFQQAAPKLFVKQPLVFVAPTPTPAPTVEKKG